MYIFILYLQNLFLFLPKELIMTYKQAIKKHAGDYHGVFTDTAKAIGVETVTLDNWSNGFSHPTVRKFAELADYLEVDFCDLWNEIYKQ